MKINRPEAKPDQALSGFVSQERGALTAFALFGLATCCMAAGLAVDVTNLYRQKENLTLAADAAAQAGIVALLQKKATLEIQAAAIAAAEKNAPEILVGKVTSGVSDVQLVRFDPKTRTLVSGAPNAVQVTLHRDNSVRNPVGTGLLRFAGFEIFEVSAESVAYFAQPGDCTSSDGLPAKGEVTLPADNRVGADYCVQSQTDFWMP
ncbi:MAG: hypothetical protein C0524_09760 [Rhodobacter sp.]|nr:hypothetical protein [Rhodobacter sp.]